MHDFNTKGECKYHLVVTNVLGVETEEETICSNTYEKTTVTTQARAARIDGVLRIGFLQAEDGVEGQLWLRVKPSEDYLSSIATLYQPLFPIVRFI